MSQMSMHETVLKHQAPTSITKPLSRPWLETSIALHYACFNPRGIARSCTVTHMRYVYLWNQARRLILRMRGGHLWLVLFALSLKLAIAEFEGCEATVAHCIVGHVRSFTQRDLALSCFYFRLQLGSKIPKAQKPDCTLEGLDPRAKSGRQLRRCL